CSNEIERRASYCCALFGAVTILLLFAHEASLARKPSPRRHRGTAGIRPQEGGRDSRRRREKPDGRPSREESGPGGRKWSSGQGRAVFEAAGTRGVSVVGWNEAKMVFDARLQQGAGKGSPRRAYCQLENRFQLRASRSSVRRAWWTSFPGV